MKIRPEVAEQLLLAKWMLDKIRIQAAPNPDRFTLATHILTAHDAAELAFASIVSARSLPLPKKLPAMMDYLDVLKELHQNRAAKGRDYFDRLNRVRNSLKHAGTFPDTKQFASVADTVYNFLSELCAEYLDIPLDDLDESTLLTGNEVKHWYDRAGAAIADGKYQESLECLAKAMFFLFKENTTLRYLNLRVGQADVNAAIKLTGFGVHANDYLTLQEFLPEVQRQNDGPLKVKWQQGRYGHPGNWHQNSADFCLKTFLDVALKIQDARWIPGPINFIGLYEHQVTAIQDEVEVWRSKTGGTLLLPKDESDRVLVRKLKKGEKIQGLVRRRKMTDTEFMMGIPDEKILSIVWGNLESGFVKESAVKVRCVPIDDDFRRIYLPDLPDMEWEPEE